MSALLAYDNLNINEHGLRTSGRFPWSLGGQSRGKNKCQAFRDVEDSGKDAYLCPTGWAGLAARPHLFLYNALKFPYGLNRRALFLNTECFGWQFH